MLMKMYGAGGRVVSYGAGGRWAPAFASFGKNQPFGRTM